MNGKQKERITNWEYAKNGLLSQGGEEVGRKVHTWLQSPHTSRYSAGSNNHTFSDCLSA